MQINAIQIGQRAYESRLKNWDSRASVRNTERRMLRRSKSSELPFSIQLVPIAKHSLLAHREPRVMHELLAQRLYSYLQFTDVLETEVVVPVCLNLARCELPGLMLDPAMAFDARRIATDEMYHAQCAADLTLQLAEEVCVAPVVHSRPLFLDELQQILDETRWEMRHLSRLHFVIVSETLITNILRGVPNDETVMPTVRETIRDHALDEARHHAYFAEILEVVWPQLTTQQKDVVGQQLARFITMFLQPDRAAHVDWLTAIGLEAKAIQEVIEDTYTNDRVVADIRLMAHPAIEHFERVGILDHSASREALEAFGLI